jgi:hypothetical protein
LHDRDFVADLFFRKYDSTGHSEPYNSAVVVGEIHLEAGIETACVKELGQRPFKVVEFFRENDSNVIVDVTISAKKFWPILPDLGAYCPGNIIVRFTYEHFGGNE